MTREQVIKFASYVKEMYEAKELYGVEVFNHFSKGLTTHPELYLEEEAFDELFGEECYFKTSNSKLFPIRKEVILNGVRVFTVCEDKVIIVKDGE